MVDNIEVVVTADLLIVLESGGVDALEVEDDVLLG